MITYEVQESPQLIITVTVHPGFIGRILGRNPLKKTWYCEDKFGIIWRDSEGNQELDVNGIFPDYECEKVYNSWRFRKNKYGESLA